MIFAPANFAVYLDVEEAFDHKKGARSVRVTPGNPDTLLRSLWALGAWGWVWVDWGRWRPRAA